MFALTIIGASIMVLSIILGVFALSYLLAHIGMIIPFRKEYQETEALLKRYNVREYTDSPGLPSYTPVLSYYNLYRRENVEKEFFNAHIVSPDEKILTEAQKNRIAEPGEKIKIQYTKYHERVSDERFIRKNQYELSRYLKPIIICVICAVIGASLLIAGIILS